jgi:ferredoxin
MKIRVDYERCVGHARCKTLAPQVFATDEVEGRIVLLTAEVGPDAAQTALRGAKACPERAIAVFDGEAQLWPRAKLGDAA